VSRFLDSRLAEYLFYLTLLSLGGAAVVGVLYILMTFPILLIPAGIGVIYLLVEGIG
jgi:hypothetical protein